MHDVQGAIQHSLTSLVRLKQKKGGPFGPPSLTDSDTINRG